MQAWDVICGDSTFWYHVACMSWTPAQLGQFHYLKTSWEGACVDRGSDKKDSTLGRLLRLDKWLELRSTQPSDTCAAECTRLGEGSTSFTLDGLTSLGICGAEHLGKDKAVLCAAMANSFG